MEKLLVVDGSNLLFQMFYGMPAKIPGPNGRSIQGTLGFVGALLRILRRVKPDHAAVFFDGECANPRCVLDPDYKANRPDYSNVPEEETPFSQLPDIFAALDCLGISWAETSGCEADDWLAGYARQYGDACEVVISSQDSDLFQLITENVQILRYRGDKTVLLGPEHIREKLGISPEQYADFKSLTGDPSDNIRGAEGIGPKTAGALMRQFGTLEALLARPEEVTRPAVRASVIRNADRLRRNKALILLQGREVLPYGLDALRWQDPGLTTVQVLSRIGLR